MINVLVCDDSTFMRRAITTMLSSDPKVNVVDTAKNGREAVELAMKHRPDVITLDVEMPEMDGLTALREIMAKCPTSVIMLSSLTTEGSRAAMQALRLGAADVLAKDQSQISTKIMSLQNDLLSRVHALAGGPPVLEKILTRVPAGSRVPIVVAQHMPCVFTKSMAERLNTQCGVPVRHGDDKMPIEPGAVHIAPGGMNTHLRKAGSRLTMHVSRDPEGTVYYPSANVLFQTAAETCGKRVLAIVLTGMGDDGVRGAKVLADVGGVILAQSAETCVVYGMPKAVTQSALATESLSPEQIGDVLARVTGAASRAA